MSIFRTLSVITTLVFVAGCSTWPSGHDGHALEHEAIAGTHRPPPKPRPTHSSRSQPETTLPGSVMHSGNGVFVRPLSATSGTSPGGSSTDNTQGNEKGVVFNFQNQPVEAVVKAILGDFLKRNYAIQPNVKGAITFSTARPVSPDQALPILETLLSWTGNALIEKDGHFLVLPARDAVAGNLTPSLGARAPGAGLTARLFPLHYISATEMKKLLKPFAPESAFLLVDSMRNLLVMAGTPEQLANYQHTIKTFDVDWLKGMSVGVFTLQHASVTQLMPKLQKLFGPEGSTPMAGMLRLLPIARTNAIVVITSQSDYLSEVHQWINRIDAGGGNQPQLYVYDVKNMRASMLASYINQIYNDTGSTGNVGQAGDLAPGLTPSTLSSDGSVSGQGSLEDAGDQTGFGRDGAGSAVFSANTASTTSATSAGNGLDGGVTGSGGVRVTAVNASNRLLVRCRPSQWTEIESAIKQLDVVPLQVQIETRILEVQLTGKFSFGVQWYLEGLVGGHPNGDGGYAPGQPGNQQQWALGAGGSEFHPLGDSFFYSFINSNLQAAIHAIETNGNTKVLSEPSLVVMNNQLASIQVGTQVPVNQTYFAPGLGSSAEDGGIGTLGRVEYKDTGVILKVRPRVNPGGLVYLNLDQIVSKPGIKDTFGNFPINKRELATQIAVQSGQTVLLGGLIQQNESAIDTGIPWLNRIPLIGRLFGSTSHERNRTELLILITPRVISSGADARAITLEYQNQFQSLKPLHEKKTKEIDIKK